MMSSDWRPIRAVDPLQLSAARLQAHYAVQWLARTARAFITPQPDDRHTSLGWDQALNGFTTHALASGIRLGLNIPELKLVLLGRTGPASTASCTLHGHTDAQARIWLGKQIGAHGFDATALNTQSPYAMPPHPLATGAAYDAAGLGDALSALAAWFANANASLTRIHQQLTEQKFDASPLRCWPHHFDLATLTTLPAPVGGTTKYIGAGLSPGDQYYDEPYFYVSLYPAPAAATRLALPKPGHLHTHEFTAAVATAHAILACQDRQAETEAFLQAAVAGAFTVLGAPS